MARHEMTLRVFRILHYLETTRSGLRVSEINERLRDDGFDVHLRTVHRDIELLQGANIPLVTEGAGPESRWKLAPFAEVRRNVQFTYPEIFALFVARKSLEHLKGSPIHTALETLFEKLEKLLGTKSETFQELLQTVSFRPQMTWHTSVPPATLDTVYMALEEGHPLKMLYRSEGGPDAGAFKARTVGPECLYFANGGVYLIAVDLSKNEPRTYALSRMQDVEMDTSQIYERQGHSPDKLFSGSFGIFKSQEDPVDVELLVEGPIGTYVAERRWHDSQQTIKTSGGVRLMMKVQLTDEFARWILGLGPSAVVTKPERLKSMVSGLADQISSRYMKKSA